jgi:NADH-quinone oxidoreductase subunit G
MALAEETETVMITVDGNEFAARPGELLIDACERAGVYIPRFCYHPRMTPVGMCRMCIVDVDAGRGAALSPSCMLTVGEGMVVDTQSDRTKKAQEGVLEFLLINHPLDCPVCDKGGECPLQDQTMSHGPGESRLVEEKRHYEKPIPVNDTVFLDRERCILCDRCTRFADEVAGDALISFMGRGNQTEVNTFPDEPFASYFSGNTVQICPVGALTAKPYRFKARPWDLEEYDSTLPNPMGDRVTVQTSRNRVLRVQGSDSDAVNWGWLTDRDRFGFEALENEDRVTEPLIRKDGSFEPASWPDALAKAGSAIAEAAEQRGPGSVAVIGGARLTNEDQYAWAKLAKGIIGTDNVDAQLDDGLPADLVVSLSRATIAETCQPGGVVVLLAGDPKEEFGTLYLRLRHAAMRDGVDLVELTPTASGLAGVASHSLRVRPGDAGAVARALVAGSSELEVGGVEPDSIAAVAALLASDRPLTIVVGRTSLAESAAAVVDAATVLAQGFPTAGFLPLLSRGNVFGALDMGLSPGLLPGRVSLEEPPSALVDAWPTVPTSRGLDSRGILEAAAAGDIELLILLGADPLADFPDAELAAAALDRVPTVLAVDLFRSGSVAAAADVVFPAAGFAECAGTHTNLEGRISPLEQAVTPPGTARSDWMIAAALASQLDADLGIDTIAELTSEMVAVNPLYGGLDFDGLRTAADGPVAVHPPVTASDAPVVDAHPVDSYSHRLVLDRTMYDLATAVQTCRSMAGLAGPSRLRLNPHDIEQLGVGKGEELRVTSPRGAITIEASADATVPRGVAAIAVNHEGPDPRALVTPHSTMTEVRVDTR